MLLHYCDHVHHGHHRRLPSRKESERRQKWIQVVSQHRLKLNPETDFFYICSKHFSQSQLKRNSNDSNKLTLKKDAVPDFFDTHAIDLLPWTEEMENDYQTEQMNEAGSTELVKIKKQLEQAEADHCIGMQNMKQKQIALKKLNKTLQIELREVKEKSRKLAETVENLKKKFECYTQRVIIQF